MRPDAEGRSNSSQGSRRGLSLHSPLVDADYQRTSMFAAYLGMARPRLHPDGHTHHPSLPTNL